MKFKKVATVIDWEELEKWSEYVEEHSRNERRIRSMAKGRKKFKEEEVKSKKEGGNDKRIYFFWSKRWARN